MATVVRRIVLCCMLTQLNAFTAASIHLPLARRSGRFVGNSPANLTRLALTLAEVEDRYLKSHRVVEDNHLVRKWSAPGSGAVDDEHLITSLSREGAWYITLDVGDPTQQLQFDLDMLAPDFYTALTTSGTGSKYDTFASKTFKTGASVHSLCSSSQDHFKLASLDAIIGLQLPTCVPPKSSLLTLASSGCVLGLGPPGSLSRLPESGLIGQLKQRAAISEDIWSITVLDSETGVLSVGGTIAREMEQAKRRADLELSTYGNPVATPEWIKDQVDAAMRLSMPNGSPIEAHFKWSPVSGSSGWWTALTSGIWINGAKVLKNQPVVFDVQSPFVLAPPKAARRFYDAIGDSSRLPPPHDMFFVFPCLSQVNIAFDLGGWNFPSMSGEITRADTLHGPAGGRLSLGKLEQGTGYCVGAVVETRMGIKDKWDTAGMQNVWVLGEPFFKSMGVVFDNRNRRIGFRSY